MGSNLSSQGVTREETDIQQGDLGVRPISAQGTIHPKILLAPPETPQSKTGPWIHRLPHLLSKMLPTSERMAGSPSKSTSPHKKWKHGEGRKMGKEKG